MKRFDFKLEPLYKLRKNIEKKKQAEVAEVSALYNKEKEGKDNCILKINDGIKIVDSIEDTSEMINMSIYLGEYMLALNSQMAIHDRKMSEIGIELRKRQNVLQEATRQRRAVEILKEKKLLEYKKLMNKEEQSKLDEWKNDYYVN
ncbi:flagellar FliJ family protein [Brachyspira pilosicoli]|uniref:Flagellar FliJ protein n=1 Tax=Brachyspira pilosicoli B2904 TaxID=1133568 RepID=J9UV19_BRAPL|nr:flagellar FliJ family protein [Brachyspira pilosicoli]AFR71079.1 flagellar export protein FliJ [Brachyspira pilosicoli B2904]